ncbi:MAG: glycosyltransferase [Actinobacteria bacterium]|nr:glycosyltransferase [Actinomycetota bacterium]
MPVNPESVEDYSTFVGFNEIWDIRQLADNLGGARVLHISSTAYGGSVAEILNSLVPLMKDLGLKADWKVIEADEEFAAVNKFLINRLQGYEAPWEPEMIDIYMKKSRENAKGFADNYDFIIVHDPEPIAILPMLIESKRPSGKWIWRCHIDPSGSIPDAWDFIRDFLSSYDAAIFTSRDFTPMDINTRTVIMTPTIDPMSLRNLPLDPHLVESIVSRFNVDPKRPLIVQVSRFDPWDDPLGVVDAYRIAKRKIPELQLAFVASVNQDDPEGFHYYRKTALKAEYDPDLYVCTNLQGIGSIEVNAFQRAADVIMHKPVREGFGLTITEALWKSRAVVAVNTGGIPLQIDDGENGFLVENTSECAERVVTLMENPQLRERFGKNGREKVRDNFLIPRELHDYMNLFFSLSG